MIRKLIITFLCSMPAIILPAESPVNKYELPIGDFTQLKVTSPINVNYICNPDSAGYAVFNCTEKVVSEIAFSNKNNKQLTVEFTTKGTKLENAPTVTVYSKFLSLAENQSDSLLRIVKTAPVPELKLRLQGNGRVAATGVEVEELSASITTGRGMITVTGKSRVANLTSYSNGGIQADNLEAKIVKCKLVGSGEIGCWPIDELSVGIGGGSGTILYRGTPKKIKNKSINIKVEKMAE